MTKVEKKDEMKNRISLALKDPVLQQGFEIICKNLADLEKENVELNRQLSDIVECFQSASSGDDFEMAESAREIMEVLGISCYRHGKVKSKLSKAKEIIKSLLSVTNENGLKACDMYGNPSIVKRAIDFIKE